MVKEEFKEKFGALLEKKTRKKKPSAPAPTLVALALQKVLSEKVAG